MDSKNLVFFLKGINQSSVSPFTSNNDIPKKAGKGTKLPKFKEEFNNIRE
tara:strand:+ start:1261 stop:1410 length:150 start_codon:yes stop_codon:yes gene_type:complete